MIVGAIVSLIFLALLYLIPCIRNNNFPTTMLIWSLGIARLLFEISLSITKIHFFADWPHFVSSTIALLSGLAMIFHFGTVFPECSTAPKILMVFLMIIDAIGVIGNVIALMTPRMYLTKSELNQLEETIKSQVPNDTSPTDIAEASVLLSLKRYTEFEKAFLPQQWMQYLVVLAKQPRHVHTTMSANAPPHIQKFVKQKVDSTG